LGQLSITKDTSDHPTQVMDQGFNPTRQVMNDLPQLLCCVCPRTPNLVMLCAILIFNILRSYLALEADSSDCAMTISRGNLGPTTPPFTAYSSASFNATDPSSTYVDHVTAQDMTERRQKQLDTSHGPITRLKSP
jgi:hypothetical protein